MKGFDFDGVVTNGYSPQQGDVIITGRTLDTEEKTRKFLRDSGLPEVKIYFYPYPEYLKRVAKTGNGIDVAIGTFKSLKVKELGITEFYEDNQTQADIIQRENPNMKVYLV